MNKFCSIFLLWLCCFHTSSCALDKIFSPKYCSDVCRARVRDGHDGHTQDQINRVLSWGNATIETTFGPKSPYTFVATTNVMNNNGNLVYLPLIIKATLKQRQTLTERKSSEIPEAARDNVANMYNGKDNLKIQGIDVGHIIAFQNGGTRDLFNFVGQTSELNKGPYKVIENEINNTINTGGTAELTIVIVYSGTRPSEFAVKLKLFNADGRLHSDLQDIILLNI